MKLKLTLRYFSIYRRSALCTLAGAIILSTLAIAAHGQTTNSWTNNVSGKWETGANWTLGAPSVTFGTLFITNTANKTVTIDNFTSALTSVMTVSNLVLSAPLNSTNTLSLNNAGLGTPLDILNTFTINGGGVLTITNSALRADGVLLIGEQTTAATVWMNGGQLTATNAGIAVGDNGVGKMIVSNGAVTASALNIGTQAGSQGTLTIAGGTTTVNGSMAVGFAAGATGAVWMTGGQLVATNFASIGESGIGQITMSNGTWLASSVIVGGGNGSQGTLTVAGGTITMTGVGSGLSVASGFGSTGAVWMTGGQLTATNGFTNVGGGGVGQMTMSNGTMLVSAVGVGELASSQGTLTVAGGTITSTSSLQIGASANATGAVWLTGGQLTVTNNETDIGMFGVGRAMISNGMWLAQNIYVGSQAGSQGTLSLVGGTITSSSILSVGSQSTTATGAVWVTGGQLTVTNIGIAVGDGGVGQMALSNGTVLASALSIGAQTGSQGTLTLAGGITSLSSILEVAGSANATGSVWLTGGQLTVTNSIAYIGYAGSGQMALSNAMVLVSTLNVGNQAGSQGTLTIAGGTTTVNGSLTVGFAASSTGSVWMTGGQLVATNSANIGFAGIGQMAVSNGTWLAGNVTVGVINGSQGTLTVAGGTVTMVGLGSGLVVGSGFGSTGAVWVTGGQLTDTNAFTSIGSGSGVGQMTMSNGTVFVSGLSVGGLTSSQGTLTVAGGTMTATSSLQIGAAPNATGTVWLTGGQLTVTNSETDIGLAGIGRMTISNNTWLAQAIYVGTLSGSQGALTLAGGTVTSSSILSVGSQSATATGAVWVIGSQLTATNIGIAVGDVGVGQMGVSNGTVLASALNIGTQAGSQGTLTLSGGTITSSTLMAVGYSANSTGAVWVTGGQLTATNTGIIVGNAGVGQMTVSNATVTLSALNVGSQAGSHGTLTIGGGTTTVSGAMAIGLTAGSTGSVFFTGGQLIANSSTTTVGGNGSGSLTISGGTMFVRDVNVGPSGTLTLQGGYLNLSGQLAFGAGSGGGAGQLAGGTLVIQPTGLLRLGTDVASASSFVTNQSIVQVLAGGFAFNGGFDNQANFTVSGGQLITVHNGLGNSGDLFVNSGGILSADSIRGALHVGSVFLSSGAQFTVGTVWTNAGVVSLQSGGLGGSAVYNTGLVAGNGGVSAPLINRSGGSVDANGGVLSLSGSDIENQAGAFLEADAGATLRSSRTFVNQGIINPQGGVIDLGANSLTNTGTLTGFGTYKAAVIVNNAEALYLGGNVNLQGTYINNASSTTEVRSASATFFGAVTNNAGGVIKNTASQINFLSTFYNNGSYISDPATNVFSASLSLGSNGALVGGKGDLFVLGSDLASANADGLQIDGATLEFTSGAHAFTLAGTAHLGSLQLDSGAALTLAGANLYVGVFDADPSQITSVDTIYYEPTENPSLDGQTFALVGGGLVEAVPEPGTWMLVLIGVGTLLRSGVRRKSY